MNIMQRNRQTGGAFLPTAEVLKPQRTPSLAEAQAISDVHEFAVRFANGRVELAEVRAGCSGKQRWLATRFTPPNDPCFDPLMLLLDALIAEEHPFQTKQGFLEPEDLAEPPGRIVYENGRTIVQFPIRWPWRVKPDPDKGIEGIRGEPIYRKEEDRGPAYGSFSRLPPVEMKPWKPDWWEAESTDDVPF
jgi:hypothetical protein